MPAAAGTVGMKTSTLPSDHQRRRRLAWLLTLAISAGLVMGLGTGASGLSWVQLWADWSSSEARLILLEIRAPRSLGAALVGALLGLAGALAQGLFRNPLADPYLLGTAAGAGLGVVAVLAGASSLGASVARHAGWLDHVGLITAAFGGALLGVALTLFLARGAAQTLRLLLAGVVVGVLLGAVSDLITTAVPDALRGKQAFLLGSTAFMGWNALAILGLGLALLLWWSWRHARALDALTLGEESAASLGLDIARIRLRLVFMLSAATALAVSQAGLVAFVGLVAPHLVRRYAPGRHGWLLVASAASGAALLLLADVLSRAWIAPEELPVGVVTAILGGSYLLWLLRRQDTR